MECSDFRSDCTAAAAIGVAALPKAKTQTRRSRSMRSACTARPVAGPGADANVAALYRSIRTSRLLADRVGVSSPLMRGTAPTKSLCHRLPQVGICVGRAHVEADDAVRD